MKYAILFYFFHFTHSWEQKEISANSFTRGWKKSCTIISDVEFLS